MYKIKEKPEDFIVKEKSNITPSTGDFVYFKLKKTNYNSLDAINRIADALHINSKRFGIAGNKDKHAVTEQVCSVKDISEARLEKLELKDIEIEILGRGPKPISLSDLEGNYFEITVRNVEKTPEAKTRFINYFGPQRFGGNNKEVGEAIVKNDFKKACELLELDTYNAIQSLQLVGKRMLRFYVHAYQSYLWNETVKLMLEKGIEKENVEIIGFGTELDDTTTEILKREKLGLRDFIIRQLPEISSEGASRPMHVEVKELTIEEKEDVILLKFFLPKGCYATVFIEQLFE